jgi:hypothetical protein
MRTVRRIINSNPHLSTAWWHFQVRLAELRGRESVVVYQMGKVGSSTLVASLHALHKKLQIHHVHTLTEKGIADAEAIYRQIARQSQSSTVARARHLLSSRYLRQRMRRQIQGKKWKVITLVREPIARNVSSFFQIIDYPLPNFMARYHAGELDMETVSNTFLTKFDHKQVLHWFETELRQALGINVFASEFPKERGYQIYQGDTCELLLIKLEKLNECACDAFRDFLGVDHFELVRTNVADDKEYAGAYRQLKEHLILPDSYVQEMYSSPTMQHFYSQAEIAAFATQWKTHHDALIPTLG